MWHEKRLLGVEGHKWWWTDGEWKAVFSLPSPKGSEATVLPVTAQTPSSINMKCLVHKRCFRLFPRISWAQRSVVAWLSWKKLKLVIPRPCEPAAGGHEVTSHSAPREKEICFKLNCFQKAWPPVQLWKRSIWRIWSAAGMTVAMEYELITDSNSGKTQLQSHSVLLPRGSRHTLHTPIPHLWEEVVINSHCEDQRGEGWVKGTQIYTQASDTVQRNQNPPLERTHGCWCTRIYILHSLPTTILFQLSSGHHWNTALCLQIQKSGIHREHMARHVRMWCLTLQLLSRSSPTPPLYPQQVPEVTTDSDIWKQKHSEATTVFTKFHCQGSVVGGYSITLWSLNLHLH